MTRSVGKDSSPAPQSWSLLLDGAMVVAGGDFALAAALIDERRLLIRAGVGTIAEGMVGNLMAVADSAAEPTFSSGLPLLIADYVHDGAAPPETRARIGSVVVVPLLESGTVAGAVAVGRRTGAITLSTGDLHALRDYIDGVDASRLLALAREERATATLLEDRLRVAADLHDHVIQDLFISGHTLARAAAETDDPVARRAMTNHVEVVDRVVERIRAIISDLPLQEASWRAQPLTQRLLAIVNALTPALGDVSPSVTVSGPIDSTIGADLADDLEAALREALTNVAKHARASRVQVDITDDGTLLTLDVIDDGVGIAGTGRSSGLSNLRRRAATHSGALTFLESPSAGTHLRWTARHAGKPV